MYIGTNFCKQLRVYIANFFVCTNACLQSNISNRKQEVIDTMQAHIEIDHRKLFATYIFSWYGL